MTDFCAGFYKASIGDYNTLPVHRPNGQTGGATPMPFILCQKNSRSPACRLMFKVAPIPETQY